MTDFVICDMIYVDIKESGEFLSNSWSGLRKKLEKEFLCAKLQGRVQYFCTHYHKAPDKYGRIAIRVDGKERILGNPYSFFVKGYSRMEFRLKKENGVPMRKWTSYGTINDKENREIEDKVKKIAMSNGVFEIFDITDAIRIYTNSPIEISLNHENPMVRLFAILDYRVGKRTLNKLVITLENQPKWLQFFYKLRFEAENIKIPQ